MSWHTPAYVKTNLANVANTDIPALTDQVLTVFNGHFLLRKPMSLIAAWAGSANHTKTRYDSPTLRYYGNPYVRPIAGAILPGSDPQTVWYGDNPFVLPAGEEIAVQATSTVGTTEPYTAALFLQDSFEALPGGNLYPVRLTSTTTVTANAWTTLTYSLDTGLPVGLYAVAQLQLQSTNGQFARMIFDEQIYRPGFPMLNTLVQRPERHFEHFKLGIAGRFRNDALPRIEVLCNAADAAFEGYLWVAKVAG